MRCAFVSVEAISGIVDALLHRSRRFVISVIDDIRYKLMRYMRVLLYFKFQMSESLRSSSHELQCASGAAFSTRYKHRVHYYKAGTLLFQHFVRFFTKGLLTEIGVYIRPTFFTAVTISARNYTSSRQGELVTQKLTYHVEALCLRKSLFSDDVGNHM